MKKNLISFMLFFAGILLIHAKSKDYQAELFQAVKSGNIALAEAAVKKKADVNLADKNGTTPLYYAAYSGNLAMVKWLVNKGANPHKRAFYFVTKTSYYGSLPSIAAGENHLALLKYLVEDCKVDVNQSDTATGNLISGWTPLQTASYSGNTEIVNYLIEHGANLNFAEENEGKTALHFALLNNKNDMATLLLEKGADPAIADHDGLTGFHYAIYKENTEVLKKMIETAGTVNVVKQNSVSPLAYAVLYGKKEMAELLLKAGADPLLKSKGYASALVYAIADDEQPADTAFLYMLLPYLKPINDFDTFDELISAAVNSGNIAAINFLVNNKILEIKPRQLDHYLFFSILYAYNAKDDKLEPFRMQMAEFLIKQGADVNYFDTLVFKMRALDFILSQYINKPVCYTLTDFLLKNGAEINYINPGKPIQNSEEPDKDPAGKAPVHLAVKNESVLSLLIKNNANIHVKSSEGYLPIHYACIQNNYQTITMLIEAGADVNASGSDSLFTPAHLVILNGSFNKNALVCIKSLFYNGADFSKKDYKNRTVYDLAKETSSLDTTIIAFLKNPLNNPFEFFSYGKQKNVKAFLLANPSLIAYKDSIGQTFMHKTALFGNKEMASFLLTKGINVNITDRNGITPLYMAVQNCNIDFIRFLVEKGANVNAINSSGVSILNLANRMNNREIIAYLKSKGAKEADAITVNPELILPVGHYQEITRIAMSADGKFLLSLGKDNWIKLWETATGREIKSYPVYAESDKNVVMDFSPSGNTFVNAIEAPVDNIVIRDIYDGSVIRTLDGLSGRISDIRFSPDGKFVAACGQNTGIWVWNIVNGEVVMRYKSEEKRIIKLNFSKDGKWIAGGDQDGNVFVWKTGNEQASFKLTGHKKWIYSVSFSSDGKYILTSAYDRTLKLWDALTGKEIRTIKWQAFPHACFSPDGKTIASGGSDKLVLLWDTETGNELKSLKGHTNYVNDVCFTPDGKYILSAGVDKTIIRWDASTGERLQVFGGKTRKTAQVGISPDGKWLVSAGIDKFLKIWNLNTGTSVESLTGHRDWISSFVFHPDSTKVLTLSDDKTLKLWELKTATLIKTFKGHTDYVETALFSDDAKYLVSKDRDGNLIVWDLTSYSPIYQFQIASFIPENEKFTNGVNTILNFKIITGNRLLVVSESAVLNYYSKDRVKTWTTVIDLANGNIKSRVLLTGKDADMKKLNFASISISPDDMMVITGKKIQRDEKGNIKRPAAILFWNITTGLLEKMYPYYNSDGEPDDGFSIEDFLYLPENGKILTLGGNQLRCYDHSTGNLLFAVPVMGNKILYIPGTLQVAIYEKLINEDYYSFLSDNKNKTISIIDIQNGKLTLQLKGHSNALKSVASAGSPYLFSSSVDNTIRLWNIETGKELAQLILLNNVDWVVKTPEGLFDASADAMKLMHYVAGNEIIELDQLKERYYEPALLAKLTGNKDEKIRDVTSFKNASLYPDVKLNITGQADAKLDISLFNRGGGIGKVMVYINGKEVVSDARGPKADPNARQMDLNIPIANHPYLVPGKENTIEVKVYNGDGYLLSRGASALYTPPVNENIELPKLFILSMGVSDYTGDDIDLRYAAKDAEDITNALIIGGNRLFGTDKTLVWQMTTNQKDEKLKPYKANILKAFAEIAKTAKSQDVLVVYLSGHGINWGGQDGDFYYLTADAYTGNIDAYNDPKIRNSCTLSSNELTELIKKVPALKQVLIMDACASGKAVENLMAKRDIASSTIRALDRMKDRVGMHIITGCAADAVSYEATRYGQGLLTYSLLEGIKGAALRENQFIDIKTLFVRSQDRVMELAADIGGIQKPEIFSPYGAQSFDIGELTEDDKAKIPLAQPKPMFLMSVFQEEESLDDIFGLEKKVDEAFANLNSKGPSSPIIFVQAKEFPEAYRIRGQYSLTGDDINVRVNIFKGKDKIGNFSIQGNKNDIPALADKIVVNATNICK